MTAMPILRCLCGGITGNPESPVGRDPQMDYRVRKYFEAAVMKRPRPDVDDLVQAYVCETCSSRGEGHDNKV